MKRTLALLGLMGLMGAAQAIPVYVDYQGVVSSVVGTSLGYAAGDVITGQLVIETDLAPEDSSFEAGYGRFNTATNPAFVSGYTSGAPFSGFVSDNVEVFDGYAGVIDGYFVSDYERTNVGGHIHQNAIELWAQSYYVDFISGTGIRQNFHMTFNTGLFYGTLWQRIDTDEDSTTYFHLTELSVRTRAVPEPSTLSLLALAGLAVFFRRRKLRG